MVEPEGPQMTSQYGVYSCMFDKQGHMHMPTSSGATTHARAGAYKNM
jgi:hypothetical protein